MSASQDQIVIASAIRTPLGRFGGALAGVAANELGAVVIREALVRAGVKGDEINEVLMGCVLPAGQGQAPARQAARKAGLPDHVGAVTKAMVLGTGLTALIQGTLVGIAFLIVGLPSPLVFAVIALLASLLPFGGTALVWGPAALVLVARDAGARQSSC